MAGASKFQRKMKNEGELCTVRRVYSSPGVRITDGKFGLFEPVVGKYFQVVAVYSS